MNLKEKLISIQTELKAPKGQYNSFGKYKYRSCEDILESVKPILAKHKVTMTVKDELLNIGERYYIKATATIFDCESDESLENTAYAREEAEKKGMDGSQITGTASSYARKYCLNGLLLIDDTKDADTDAYKLQQTQDLPKAAMSEEEDLVRQILKVGKNKVESINQFTNRIYNNYTDFTECSVPELKVVLEKLTEYMAGK